MQNDLKLLVVQKFDPETDYSSYDEAELEGAFDVGFAEEKLDYELRKFKAFQQRLAKGIR